MRFGAHMPFAQSAEQNPALGGQGGQGQGQGQGSGGKRRGHLRQRGGVGMLLHHAEDFGLGPKDIEALETLQEQHELEKVRLEYEEKAAKIRFRHAMRRPSSTREEVASAAKAVADAELNMRMMRFDHLAAASGAVKGASGKVVDVAQFVRQKRSTRGGGGAGGGGGSGGGRGKA